MQDDTQNTLPPERIGSYQRVDTEPIGEGGMGVVWHYKGAGEITKQEYAIKFIKHNEDEGFNRKTLIKEVQILEGMEPHTNIIRMYAPIEEGNTLAIVMEYIPGGLTLRKIINDHPDGLPINLIMQIMAGILSGLSHAHESDVFHRDIKPENILLKVNPNNPEITHKCVRITDFGISKSADIGSGTMTTRTAYSPPYAAPEQFNLEPTGAFTDVYSLGVILYEMLGGRKPFTGKPMEVATGHCYLEPPQINREGIPADLNAIWERSLKKIPFERYQNAAEMLEAFKVIDWTKIETVSTQQSGCETDGRTIVSGRKRHLTVPPLPTPIHPPPIPQPPPLTGSQTTPIYTQPPVTHATTGGRSIRGKSKAFPVKPVLFGLGAVVILIFVLPRLIQNSDAPIIDPLPSDNDPPLSNDPAPRSDPPPRSNPAPRKDPAPGKENAAAGYEASKTERELADLKTQQTAQASNTSANNPAPRNTPAPRPVDQSVSGFYVSEPSGLPQWPNKDAFAKANKPGRYEEDVKVRVHVGPNGSPRRFEVIAGKGEFHKNAIEWAKGYRWSIAKDYYGNPKPYTFDVEVLFAVRVSDV